jgi:hypothetical protein
MLREKSKQNTDVPDRCIYPRGVRVIRAYEKRKAHCVETLVEERVVVRQVDCEV